MMPTCSLLKLKMLSLKITEEPPASSLIILVTSDIESILPTILSRLEKLYFGIVPEKEVGLWLREEHKLTVPKAAAAAKQVFGKPALRMRLSERWFVQ